MLSLFWSVADCNRHGCAVQCDALSTQTKRRHEKRRKYTQETCSINVFVIKKGGESHKDAEREREREREMRQRVSVYAAACAPLPCHPYPSAFCEVLLVFAHTSAWQASLKPSSCCHPLVCIEATKKCNMR